MRTINQRIEHLLDKDHCIGHSYFYKVTDFQSLQQVFAKNILPLLQEYFYGDLAKWDSSWVRPSCRNETNAKPPLPASTIPTPTFFKKKWCTICKTPLQYQAEGTVRSLPKA